MMTLDFDELIELKNSAGQSVERIRKQAVGAVKGASFAVERRVKQEMPVDTGRARASWGHWGGAAGGPGDAHWLELDGGLAIEQGSNVDYIVFLNAGHSRQAGAGFIDRAAAHGQLELERALELVDPLSAREISLFAGTLGNS